MNIAIIFDERNCYNLDDVSNLKLNKENKLA